MDYSVEILDKIDIINHALKELDKPPLLDNADFILDESSSAVYLKFYLKKRLEDIAITITLSCFEIQIDIDRVNEAFVWDNAAIQKDRNGLLPFWAYSF